jgi:hypothetical protein
MPNAALCSGVALLDYLKQPQQPQMYVSEIFKG